MRTMWVLGGALGLVGMVVACGATTSAGDGADGGGGGGACETAATFELRVQSGAYCAGAPAGCDAEWLTILGPDGQPLARDNSCKTNCDACGPVGCPAICAQPSPIAGAVKKTWDGRVYTQSTCKTATDTFTCGLARCAAKGRFVARMCAYPSTLSGDGGADAASDAASSVPTRCAVPAGTQPSCVDVPFDWPSQGSIVGTIP